TDAAHSIGHGSRAAATRNGATGAGIAAVRSTEITVDTGGRPVVDITREVRAFCSQTDDSGLLNVFLPHATAGLALMETGSGSEQDLESVIEGLVPRDDRYAHRHGSRGHGGDHLLPVFVSP